MKKAKLILSFFLSICLAGFLTWKSYGNNDPTQVSKRRWEHRIVSLELKPHGESYDERILNRFGQNGWELVGITSENQPVGQNAIRQFHVFCFKRAI